MIRRVVMLLSLALGAVAPLSAQDPELLAARQAALQRLESLPPTALEERLGIAESLLESFLFAPDETLEVALRMEAGDLCLDLQRHAAARDHYLRAVALIAPEERPDTLMIASGNLAMAQLALGEVDEAHRAVLAALEGEERVDVPESRWRLLNMLGGIQQRRGIPAEAFEAYRDALGIVQELRDADGLKTVLNNVGVSALEAGRPEEALQFFERSHEVAFAQGDRHAMATALSNIGEVLHQLERDEEALAHHEQAHTIHREQGSEPGMVVSLMGMGVAHHGLANLERAEALLREALDKAEAQELKIERIQVLASLSRVLADQGRVAESLAVAADSAEALEQSRAVDRRREVLTALADAHESAGDLAAALEHTREAAAIDAAIAKQVNEAYSQLLLDMETRAREAEAERAASAEAESARQAAANRVLTGLVVAVAAAGLLGFLLLAAKRRAHRDLEAAHARLEEAHATLAERNAELESARRTIDELEGFLSLCANCKAYRNQDGEWLPVEGFIHEHVDAQISHGICPTCLEQRYGLPAERPSG